MLSFSVERRATRIVDGVEKLRYLRAAARRKPRRSPFRHLLLLPLCFAVQSVNPKIVEIPRAVQPLQPEAFSRVWAVEETSDRIVFSNGLVVRNDFTTTSEPRRYRAYTRAGLTALSTESQPAGIVYHSTESLIVPIEPEQSRSLVRTKNALLAYVRRGRLYNFVIDRLGQVYRVVPEDQVAFHAGHSIWADAEHVYIDLNPVFLGISFEAQTDAAFQASAAQVHAGRLLTEMLRSRYRIAEGNCVTHAQVSVNPDNMRLGYHTDWASRFPFHDLGLETGYSATVAAISIFGVSFDDHFLGVIGGLPWPGLLAAEKQLTEDAAARGMTTGAYRNFLQQQYRNLRRQHRHERS